MAETKPKSPNRKSDGRGRARGGREDDDELIDKLVHINRVAKVIKGGRRFSFGALVVVGDGRGRVGGKVRKAWRAPDSVSDAAA